MARESKPKNISSIPMFYPHFSYFLHPISHNARSFLPVLGGGMGDNLTVLFYIN
jgi:hypothetical protein